MEIAYLTAVYPYDLFSVMMGLNRELPNKSAFKGHIRKIENGRPKDLSLIIVEILYLVEQTSMPRGLRPLAELQYHSS